MKRPAITLALVFCVAVQSARADGEAATPGNDTEYNALVKRGLTEFDLGHFPEAKAFFLRAHQVRPSARTLRGLGLAAYELRSYVEALTYLRQALASQERPLSEDMRGEVKTTIEEAKSFVAHHKLVIEPRDALVHVDGQPAVFDDDGSLVVDAGEHVIELQAPGFEPQSRTVIMKGGEHTELRLTLRSLSPDEAPHAKPASVAKPQPNVEQSYWGSLTTQHKIGLALGTGGVVALGVGTVFSILAVNDNAASKDNCSGDRCNVKGVAQRESAVASADAATVAFLAGGVLISAGIATYFTAARAKETVSALNVSPVLAPGIAAIAARGRW